MAANRKFLIASSVFFLILFTHTQNSQAMVFEWKDFTKPFNKQFNVSGVTTVEVDLPDFLLNNFREIPLVIEHSGIGYHSIGSRTSGILTINEQDQSQGYRLWHKRYTGKPIRLLINTKQLKTGSNKLHFRRTSDIWWGNFDIYKIYFDLQDIEKIRTVSAGSPSPSDKTPLPVPSSLLKVGARIKLSVSDMRSNKRLSDSQRINRMMKLPASPTDMIKQKMEAAFHAKGFRLAQDGEFLYHVDLNKYRVNRVGSGHPSMISGEISIHIKISASDGRLLATRAISEERLKGGEGFFLDQSAGKVLELCLEKAVERSVSDPILLAALEHAVMDDSKPKEAFAVKALQSDTTPPEILITSHDTSRGIRPVQSRKKVTISGKATDENDIVEITINSKDVIFDEAGNFEADIYLKMGENLIDVSAMDVYENRSIKAFTIKRVAPKTAAAATTTVQPAAGRYYALVIGNNNYQYLRKLKTAKKDAREIIDILKVRFGFKTTLLLDASRNAIIGSLNNFRKKLGADDHFLIYYAGHGEFDKSANKAYWLPVDARSDDDTNWIIVDTITSNIRRIASKHVLVVSDSCYSGTLTRRAVSDFHSSEKRNIYLQKMLSKKSRTLLASGGNEPVSDFGGEGHSIFAKAFLLGLKNIDAKKFTAEELYIQYIKEMVAGSSEQTPEYNIIRNSGHEGGAFVFRRTN